MIPATREECLGLERAAVWGLNHIIDRIMNDNRHTKDMEGDDFEEWEKHRKRRLFEAGFNME